MEKAARTKKSVESISEPLTEKIHFYEPDIAIITETHTTLDLGPNFYSLWTAPSQRKPLEGEAVASIFCRYPLQPVATFDQSEAIAAIAEHPSLNLLVYGSIIVYFGYKGKDGQSRPYEEQLKSIANHGDDWRRLRRTFPDFELLTGGDYNARLNLESRNVKVKQRLLQEIHSADLMPLTDGKFGVLDARPSGTIDHVCVTPALAQSAFANDWYDRSYSDHNLIVVDLDV